MARKYNVRDPKYYDAKHLAHYLAKELKEKDFKIKFEAPKKEAAIGAMTEEGSARGGKIKITGNPAKIAGKLPDGWSFDPATNTIKNGNKAEAEIFEVEPIDKKKPIKEFVDMSDVMYAIRVARPDLKVTALDSTTFGIDLNGRSPDEIDWKKIGGSKLDYDKATGTVNVETDMGQKLSFNVMTTGAKTEKQEEVREATYTSNADGVMENGFSEGNRKTVENTAGSLLEGLSDIGHHAIAMHANLNTFSLEEAKKQVLDAFGKVDILINGAGGNNPKGTSDDEFYTDESAKESVKSFFELDQAGIQFVLNLNFMGTLLPTQTFAPLMLNKNGVIINISSMNAYRPLTKIPAYSGAKAAISNFTQYLAVYFAKAGIRVNAIAPGFFVTHQNRGLLFNEDGTPTARTGKILNATPMGRFGEASELGGTLMWLVDNEAASFVTGIVVPVDGGFSAYSGV